MGRERGECRRGEEKELKAEEEKKDEEVKAGGRRRVRGERKAAAAVAACSVKRSQGTKQLHSQDTFSPISVRSPPGRMSRSVCRAQV